MPAQFFGRPRSLIMFISILLVLLSGCGVPALVDPTPVPILPTPTPSPTIAPTRVALPATPESRVIGVSAADSSGDPRNGEKLFKTFQPLAGISCITCHRIDSDGRLVGPGLGGVATRAVSRVPGLTAAQYLRESILVPSAYLVEGFTDLMPKTWGKVFKPAQIDDLVAFLLTLK